MNNSTQITFGDTVKIASNTITKSLRINDKIGTVFGETTPSVTKIDVIGANDKDFAFNIYLEDEEKAYWLSPELVSLVHHTPGLKMSVKNVEATRTENGKWIEKRIPWWKFWKK